ncbi:hypothetical protein [Lewinella sp. IMCC34183]|uniref:hypothetical protein n=1 Tax=Lewinella sp. IMCC34183 TaxID=2248762 RepID=UPI000E22E665|nr:hypothetical protein [Lewinella sp. IMCC34183]
MKHCPSTLLLLALLSPPLLSQQSRFAFSVDLPLYFSAGEAASSQTQVADLPGVTLYHPRRLRYHGPTLGVEVRAEYAVFPGLFLGLGAGINVDPRERSNLGDGGTYQRKLLPLFVSLRKEWLRERAWPLSLTVRGGHQVYHRRDAFRRTTALYTERGAAFAGTDLGVTAGRWALRPTLSVGASVQSFFHTNRLLGQLLPPGVTAPTEVRYRPYLVAVRTSLGFRF